MIKSFWPNEWPFEQIVSQLPDKGNLIEIGTYLGKSAIAWADEFNKADKDWNIHTIDSFSGIPNVWSEDNPNIEFFKSLVISGEEQLKQFKENIEGKDNITWEKIFWTPDYKTDEWYDVLFHDGAHGYGNCKQALEYWVDRTECMVIDDYEAMFPGTMKAVDEVYASMRDPKEFEQICVEGKQIAVIWSIKIP